MIGAIIGDVVGSRYEFNNHRSKDFPLLDDRCFFTDDTVLTIAIMDWALHSQFRDSYSVARYLQKWARKYPDCGFGGFFKSKWMLEDNPKPYGSIGNGCGMRISPVAYITVDPSELLLMSEMVTCVTHNSRDGVEGARCIAYATWMALHGSSKEDIRRMAESIYPEIASFDYEDLKKNYRFNELAKTTCPQAVYCFLISNSFEDCLRTTVSIGGDTDTLCAMSCAIAEAYYKDVPSKLAQQVREMLPKEMQRIIEEFYGVFEDDDFPPVIELKKD